MSAKKVLGIGLAVVGIVLAIPTVGASLGLSTLAIAAIEVGIAIASNVLLGPSMPKVPGSLADGGRDRLYATLDTTTPRKILFGNTAGATDVRYQAFTGTDQEYLEQIICDASHKVNSIYEIWFDNEKAWDSTSGVESKFSGFLTVTTRTEGTSANGIAIDSVWTSTATLTGCAYFHLKMLLIHEADDGSNDSPFSTGVTNRVTVRCKGAYVYDPRLDDTVTGGTGDHRSDDQSTWEWDDDGSRNPALQLLWYLLGWRINDKLAVGMGLPASRIDLESFIDAANLCDESVTLADEVTTEPRYRSDGVLSEGDDRQAVVETLCATMNAVLRDSGGKLSLYVLHNDLASPVASFDENDIIGSIEWDQTPDLSSTFNIVRGRRIDPTDDALYQPVDFAEVSLDSPDGIDRIDTVDYPLVQSNGQAQRLAKQRLERNQYQGRLSFTGKSAWWKVSLGDVTELTLPFFGWEDKLFRLAGQKISRTGETETVLVEENEAIYAWDNDESPAVTPGTPTVYDATVNHPTPRGINKALEGTTVIDPIADVIVLASVNGTVKTGQLPRNIFLTASNTNGDVTADGTWGRTDTEGATTSINSSTGVFAISALTASDVSVPVSFAYGNIIRTATVHIVRQDDPPTDSGGSGSTGASTTTLGNTTGTSYDTTNAVSAVLTITAGASGEVDCSAPIGFIRTGSATGSTGAFGKWQWRVPAGSWADVDTEVQESVTARATTVTGELNELSGTLTVNQTKTGLTASSDYEFRFVWRRRDVSGTAENVAGGGTMSVSTS